jgi:hypothetical protein
MARDKEHRTFELLVAQSGAELFKMGRASGVISAESKLKNTSRSIAGLGDLLPLLDGDLPGLRILQSLHEVLASFAAWFGSKERNFIFGWSELTMSPVDGS